ncbi:hypothetical protein JMJ77_0001344 [Colletotrichum scovillei]|uniref:Uncharacterized protein n=1 Tax=Colletotrichum scovillei TaxID=1209932 RepID=A0A9P7RBF2_9PEZI|nr:hypothetical protein JMJ77_0001344 [Colletotrichum scovillei]KAG7072567.1 hypothetical protein JMJ76_0005416 [Colletotrichum scovillei]KAG7080867.1 hypothetical protein JMJ78_0007951 [Colletotrichum scovillei]
MQKVSYEVLRSRNPDILGSICSDSIVSPCIQHSKASLSSSPVFP